MKTIPLTQGKVALVDDEDYEELSKFRWYAHTGGTSQFHYARRVVRRPGNTSQAIYMHRVILGVTSGGVDHINGDSLDNRRSNLRPCSQSENNWNSKKRTGLSSQYKGVTRFRGKWHARISARGEPTFLGVFTDEKEAALAYDAAARELFGEFARLNFKAADAAVAAHLKEVGE